MRRQLRFFLNCLFASRRMSSFSSKAPSPPFGKDILICGVRRTDEAEGSARGDLTILRVRY
jgi:hypothetical protein